jgi:hypothetical protein
VTECKEEDVQTVPVAKDIYVNKENMYELVDKCKVYNVEAIVEALGDCDNNYVRFLHFLQDVGDKRWEFVEWCDQVARFSPASFREVFNYQDKSKIYEMIRERAADVARWKSVFGLNNFFEVILYRLKKAEPLVCDVKHVEEIAIDSYVKDCMKVVPAVWIGNGYVEVRWHMILLCGELYDLACRLIQWEEDREAVRKFKYLMLEMKAKRCYLCEARIDPLKEDEVAGK